MHPPSDLSPANRLSRRGLLRGLTTVGAASALAGWSPAAVETTRSRPQLRGRIRQSIVFWCFNTAGERWSLERTCQVARQLGCLSVEIVPPEDWDVLHKHQLTCAIAPNGMPGMPFVRGYNNPRYHEELNSRLRKMIDACAEAHVPNVIAFSGYKWRDADNSNSGEISRGDGADNCVKGLRGIV